MFDKLPTLIRFANHMDYVLTVVCLGLALYTGSPWWWAGAAISLVCALTNPVERFHRWLIRRLTASERS